MPQPKSASDITRERDNLAISYYFNALEIEDPNGKILSRPRKGLSASALSNLRAAKTEENLGLSVFQIVYPNIVPNPAEYPPTRIYGPNVELTASGSFTVPLGYSDFELHLWGGGGVVATYSGTGAYVTGTFSTSTGNSFNVAVNAGRGIGRDGRNGGGYTGIYRGTNTQANYIAIAGGGGSACSYGGSYKVGGGATWSGTAYQGGVDGTSQRSTAVNLSGGVDSFNESGGGGSQTQGGESGFFGPGPGTALKGADGSNQPDNAQPGQTFAAGGGGGYFGGGGGSRTYYTTAAGGGGSSYTGGIQNPSGEDGSTGGGSPGGTTTKFYVPGYGGVNQGGRCVVVFYKFGSVA